MTERLAQDQGRVHIYCGEGKGKTTAAAGLALRYAGNGGPVLFVQFLKDGSSSEIGVLQKIPGICVLACRESFGFTYAMTQEERERARRAYGKLFAEAKIQAAAMERGLLVLDEVLAAIQSGMLAQEDVERFLGEKPYGLEVVLTGRQAGEGIRRLADYVTCMACEKHPYESGLQARPGIEY